MASDTFLSGKTLESVRAAMAETPVSRFLAVMTNFEATRANDLLTRSFCDDSPFAIL